MTKPRDQQTGFDALQGKSPEIWLAYLSEIEESEQELALSPRIIWGYSAGLAKELSSLEWAEVAIRAIQIDAAKSRDKPQGDILYEDGVADGMALHSWFISRMGSREGHPVLDKHTVMVWVANGLPASLSQFKGEVDAVGSILSRAKTDSSAGTQTVNQLRMMRRVKRRLMIATQLVQCGELVPDSALQAWLDLLPQIP